jgi:hypothetical protein
MFENDDSGSTFAPLRPANGWDAGMLPSRVANTATGACRRHAQKTSSQLRQVDRRHRRGGKNMAPAHGYGAPAASVPDTSSAPRDCFAPPATVAIAAVEAPPIMLSVEVCQPAPNSARTSAPSKSLTRPVVVGASAGAAGAVGFVL